MDIIKYSSNNVVLSERGSVFKGKDNDPMSVSYIPGTVLNTLCVLPHSILTQADPASVPPHLLKRKLRTRDMKLLVHSCTAGGQQSKI